MRNIPALFNVNGSVIVEKSAPENHQNLGKVLCRNGGPDRANGPRLEKQRRVSVPSVRIFLSIPGTKYGFFYVT